MKKYNVKHLNNRVAKLRWQTDFYFISESSDKSRIYSN